MTTFIFIHGSFHAAWNWHKVIPLLESAGHRAVALDMPGHGLDSTSARGSSLEACVKKVLACIEAQPDRVVLVAHSRNGIVASQVAERCPQKVLGLVYLAAYLVPNGRSMMEYAVLDDQSLVVQNVTPQLSKGLVARVIGLFKHSFFRWLIPLILPRKNQSHTLDRAVFKEALYHDCPDEITQLANVVLEPEPNWAGFTPLRLSANNYGRLPKTYIECLQDRAVTLPLQRRMIADTACDRVFSLDTGHSPFFSQPAAFVDTLVQSLGVFAR